MAGMDYPSSWGPITDPVVKQWWDGQSADNKKSWNAHAGLSNNNHPSTKVGWKGAAVKPGDPGWRGRAQQQSPGSTQSPAGQQPAPINYQSGLNVGGGIGKHGILNGLLDIGQHSDPNVASLARATALNDAGQIGRGIDAKNQELMMQQQAKRSELTTEGASNMAKVYGDMAERGASQIGLAAQIAANNIGFAAGMQSAFDPWNGFNAAQSKYYGGKR